MNMMNIPYFERMTPHSLLIIIKKYLKECSKCLYLSPFYKYSNKAQAGKKKDYIGLIN